MKRIKITEEQAKRLKLINENEDPIAKFELMCKAKINEVNKLYAKVINLNVAEIISNTVSLDGYLRVLDSMEKQLNHDNHQAYKIIETLPENDLDLRIDNATEMVSKKLTSLYLIVNELETLQKLSIEHSLPASFKDVTPIDITPKTL